MTEVKKRGRPPKKESKINYIDIYSNDMTTGQYNNGLNIDPLLLSTNNYTLDSIPPGIKSKKSGNNGHVSNNWNVPNNGNSSNNISPLPIKSYALNINNKHDRKPSKIVNNIILHLKIPKDIIMTLENSISNGGSSIDNEVSEFNYYNSSYLILPDTNISKNNTINNDADEINHNSGNVETNNLLINNGINYKIHKIMANFYDKSQWPISSSYCCWYCCHEFSSTPVGIPEKIIIENNNICFELSGNFCSYNCGYTYINPKGIDDISGINNSIDHIYSDDKSNKIQLLELLCSLECNTEFLSKIKPAPPRLSLKMFGGPLCIQEYRENFNTHNEYHIFKYPVVPITYNIGELIKKNPDIKKPDVGIDYSKVEYICKIWENKCKNKTHSFSFSD